MLLTIFTNQINKFSSVYGDPFLKIVNGNLMNLDIKIPKWE